MLIDLVAIGSWLAMCVAMVYGALHPKRLTAARRAVMSDGPLAGGDVKLVYALSAFVVSISAWAWYVTRAWPSILFGALSIALCLVITLARKSGFGRLAGLRLPVRLGGAVLLGIAVRKWDGHSPAFFGMIALFGIASIVFPATMSRLSNFGMTEEREIAMTRYTGILGGLMAAFVVAMLTYMMVRHQLAIR